MWGEWNTFTWVLNRYEIVSIWRCHLWRHKTLAQLCNWEFSNLLKKHFTHCQNKLQINKHTTGEKCDCKGCDDSSVCTIHSFQGTWASVTYLVFPTKDNKAGEHHLHLRDHMFVRCWEVHSAEKEMHSLQGRAKQMKFLLCTLLQWHY